MTQQDVRSAVMQAYGKIAVYSDSCCEPGCCGTAAANPQAASEAIGYSAAELAELPEGANLGLGCGNPVALASLKEGETVLDLGSGAGIDCFLAAKRVGPTGRAIGVDMTHEMLKRARENAAKVGFDNVEFRLGEIEALPVADASVDVVISNCVINLSPEKDRVFQEAFRVLKLGGRLAVSDIVLLGDLPDAVLQSIDAYVGCLSGAVLKDAYLQAIRDAGFSDVEVVDETVYPMDEIFEPALADALRDELKVPQAELDAIGSIATSLKVQAFKA